MGHQESELLKQIRPFIKCGHRETKIVIREEALAEKERIARMKQEMGNRVTTISYCRECEECREIL